MSGFGELRRLDWRFLLPYGGCAVGRAVLLGATEDVARRAVDVGLAERVDVTLGGGDDADDDRDDAEASADLVAVLAPAGSSDVERVAGAVRPGGYLYWEVDRRTTPRRSPAELIERLEAAGLSVVGVWAVLPAFDRAESYVALHVPAPLPWFLEHHYRATRVVQLVGRTVVRVLVGRDGRRFLRLAPLTAVVAVAGPTPVADTGVLVTDGGNRSVWLRFAPDDVAPRDVTKIPKLPSFAARTLAENRTLVALSERTEGVPPGSVPAPVGTGTFGDVAVAVETPISGHPLGRWATPLHVRRSARDLMEAMDWLAAFHAGRPTAGAPDAAAWILGVFDEYEDLFGVADGRLLHRARAEVERLSARSPLEAVYRHTDFTPWNLLRTGSGIGVIDWEGASPGAPMTDAIHCCTRWHESVGRFHPRSPDAPRFRRVFVEARVRSRADAAAVAGIERYRRALRIDEAWTPALIVVTWAELAVRRHRQVIDGAGALVDARRDNVGVDYLRLLTDGVDRIFPPNRTRSLQARVDTAPP